MLTDYQGWNFTNRWHSLGLKVSNHFFRIFIYYFFPLHIIADCKTKRCLAVSMFFLCCWSLARSAGSATSNLRKAGSNLFIGCLGKLVTVWSTEKKKNEQKYLQIFKNKCKTQVALMINRTDLRWRGPQFSLS